MQDFHLQQTISLCVCVHALTFHCMTFISVSDKVKQKLIFPPGHFMTTLGTSTDVSKGKKTSEVCFKEDAHAHRHSDTHLRHTLLWSCHIAAPSICESQRKVRQNCLYTSCLGENIKLCVGVHVHDCDYFSGQERLIFFFFTFSFFQQYDEARGKNV